ncbi:MAG: murein L,D-transpeptidase catalytic domain-containing protein [Bdellovibrionales bacterium]
MKTILLFIFLLSANTHAFSSKSEKKVVEKVPVDHGSFIKNSEFKKSFNKVTKDRKKFSLTALTEAYKFLDENSKKLNSEELCFKKDNIRNRKTIRNQSCLVVADYSKSKKTPRLLVINPKTGESELFYTAHGKGSHNKDEIETGHLAKRFSNISGSNMTSLGFYLTDNIYNSSKSTFGPGPSNGLKMDGINCSNNNARMRYIVMHTADYVQPLNGDITKIGNSEGCVTLPEHRKDVIKKCKGGALVYAYYSKESL